MSAITTRIAKLEARAPNGADFDRLIVVSGGGKLDDVDAFLAAQGIEVAHGSDWVLHMVSPDGAIEPPPMVLSSVSSLREMLDHVAGHGRSLVSGAQSK